MNTIDTGSGTVDYATVRNAMNGEPFPMSLTDDDEIKAVVAAVNQGIDAHLEACFVPDRGDKLRGWQAKGGETRPLPNPGMCHQPRISSHPSPSSVRIAR